MFFFYLDDGLIASTNEEEHKRHLDQLFQRFKEYGLVINPAKCIFGVEEVPFLGYLVNSQGIRPLPEKVAAIRDFVRPTKAKELRRFLGMVNFYRICLPDTAQLQAPLNDLLQGNIKGNAKIAWDSKASECFEKLKESLAQATLLAHPEENAFLALFCDASDTSVAAALQQKSGDKWEPLGFYSKKLSPTESQYSAFDRELLAIYNAVKFFKHMLEARTFTIYTDHKPLIYAFNKKPEKSSPRQSRHLSFISEFTTDIRHISGKDNIVADTLSRVESSELSLSYEDLATSQSEDAEMQTYLQPGSSLQLKKVQLPGTNVEVYCDVSTAKVRPYITQPFRRTAFQIVHNLAHPGVKATTRLVSQRFVWPSLKSDCRVWARACIPCQKSKISRHVSAPVSSFALPSGRFQHVHIDIITMPYSAGKRYCLTCIDRFSRWPEVFPMTNQEAETVARTFYEGWICRFGTPQEITTDQGRQFESRLFKALGQITGSKIIHTTAYHPAANGMIERLHRQLKAAIRCHQNDRWTTILPTVLLGIRAAWKEDLQTTSAELVYGEPIRLPGEFLSSTDWRDKSTESFIRELRHHFNTLRPSEVKRHGDKKPFIFKELSTCDYVFLRHDAQRDCLQMPYDGPFKVIKRGDKNFVIDVKGKECTVSIDRLKPAYIISDEVHLEQQAAPPIPLEVNVPQAPLAQEPSQEPPRVQSPTPVQAQENPTALRRSCRRVRFVERYQAGFN